MKSFDNTTSVSPFDHTTSLLDTRVFAEEKGIMQSTCSPMSRVSHQARVQRPTLCADCANAQRGKSQVGIGSSVLKSQRDYSLLQQVQVVKPAVQAEVSRGALQRLQSKFKHAVHLRKSGRLYQATHILSHVDTSLRQRGIKDGEFYDIVMMEIALMRRLIAVDILNNKPKPRAPEMPQFTCEVLLALRKGVPKSTTVNHKDR